MAQTSIEVRTYREGDYVIVVSDAYRKKVYMGCFTWNMHLPDMFCILIDGLSGKSWESRVRLAQKEAFEAVYLQVMREERINYQVSRFQ